MSLAVTYSLQLSGKMQWATRQSCEAENHLTAVERLGHFRNLPSEQYMSQSLSPDLAQPVKGQWPLRGEVEFQNVTLRYRDHLPDVFARLSLHLSAGERV